MSQRQLTKSVNNRMVSGVIAGISEYFGLGRDVVTILRILFVVLAFGSWGGLIPLYFIASWIMPSANGQRRGGNWRDDAHGRQERYHDRYDRYEDRWERKARRFDEKMDDFSRRYEDKFANKTNQNAWNNPWEEPKKNQDRKMKDAEPIIDEKEDAWSDF